MVQKNAILKAWCVLGETAQEFINYWTSLHHLSMVQHVKNTLCFENDDKIFIGNIGIAAPF